MEKSTLKAAGLALALALAPAAAKAVEVLKTEDVKVDVGARMQLLGTFQNSVTTEHTGVANRDFTEIYLFQRQNRLKLGADLQGVKFRNEITFGNEAFVAAGGTNPNANSYNVFELNAEIPVTENIGIVAGVFRRPENQRDATYDENLLFTGESQLANLFFNSGSDLGLYAKAQLGELNALLGVVQGTANLPERYIPEHINLPVPVIARIGYGNLKDDPSHPIQVGFDKVEDLQYNVGGGVYWLADSNAGHGVLFSQLASQAEVTKGPFAQGNMLFSGSYYNPFMKLGTYNTALGSQGPLDSQFWAGNVDAKVRVPMGEATLVAGATWQVSQFIVKGLYNRPKGALNPAGGVLINLDGEGFKEYTYGQITVQGGEAYLGYVADKWWAAARVDVLVPDKLMGAAVNVVANQRVTVNSAFKDNTLWEVTLPALGYRINKFVTLTAELEHNFNAIEAVDTDGEYQLKTVPIESGLALKYQPYQLNGRMQLQVAF